MFKQYKVSYSIVSLKAKEAKHSGVKDDLTLTNQSTVSSPDGKWLQVMQRLKFVWHISFNSIPWGELVSILLINPSVFLKYSPMFLRPNCWIFCAMNCRCIEIFKMVGDGTFKAGNISNQSTPGRQKNKGKKIEYETQVYPDPRCIGFLFPCYQMAHLVRITFSVWQRFSFPCNIWKVKFMLFF